MTDTMNYLKREDESQLEQWGYTPYNGEYGWSCGNTPLFKIIGRSESGRWAVFEIAKSRFGDRRDEDLKFTGVDGYIRNTLAPELPKEITVIPYLVQVEHPSQSYSDIMLHHVCNVESVENWMRDTGRFDVIFRRKE